MCEERHSNSSFVLGKPLLHDQNEEEVRGYRDALQLIHEQGVKLPVSEETILKLHRLTRGEIWDAGHYKEKDSDIIEKYPDGRERVRCRRIHPLRPGTRLPRCQSRHGTESAEETPEG